MNEYGCSNYVYDAQEFHIQTHVDETLTHEQSLFRKQKTNNKPIGSHTNCGRIRSQNIETR